MMKCAVIGAGQLGSRHLQGILTYRKTSLKVFVVDPSDASLQRAEQRSREISHPHRLTYVRAIKELPVQLDLVVVATNSDVRAAVVCDLFNHSAVKRLILEKVLFQSIEEYDAIEKLLTARAVDCFVNHPRRMFSHYRNLREYFHGSNDLSAQAVGRNWGLGCNAVHIIDLFEFLTGSALSELDTSGLDPEILPSKRAGFVEFTGTLSGRLSNGGTFQISSFAGTTPNALSISLLGSAQRCTVHEAERECVLLREENAAFTSTDIPLEPKFQSELSGLFIEEFAEGRNSGLTDFKSSFRTHRIYIAALLAFFRHHRGAQHIKLPIT